MQAKVLPQSQLNRPAGQICLVLPPKYLPRRRSNKTEPKNKETTNPPKIKNQNPQNKLPPFFTVTRGQLSLG